MFIVPIRKDTPVRHTSWVVYTLILVNFVVFAATSILSPAEEAARRFGFIPMEHDPTTALTSMFLHADLLHILGNMLFLWLFGEAVEAALGHTLTVISYITCGVLAISFHYLVNNRSPIPCIGASGAISGMVGMYMVLFPRARVDLEVYVGRFCVGTIATSSVWAIGAWLGEQALLGVFARATGWSFGVAFMAHVGGLLAGIGLGLALTWSGIPGHSSRLGARKTSPFMNCPSCARRGPRLPAGIYTCRTCGAKLRVDVLGDIGLVDPSKAGPPTWIVLAILLVVFGWVVRMFYDFSKQ